MIRGLALLLLFQLAGEVLTRLLDLPVPGPVVGMVLLLAALQAGMTVRDGLRTASGGLLAHLSILFVPAGVGVIQHLDRLRDEWVALTASLLVSTASALAVTGWVASRLGGAAAAPSPSEDRA